MRDEQAIVPPLGNRSKTVGWNIVHGQVIHGRSFRFSTHHPTKSSSRACSTTVNPTSVYENNPAIGARGIGKKWLYAHCRCVRKSTMPWASMPTKKGSTGL